MSAPLRFHAAEAAAVFDAAVEDADELELLDVVERAAWALLFAAETSRIAAARAAAGRGCNGRFIARRP